MKGEKIMIKVEILYNQEHSRYEVWVWYGMYDSVRKGVFKTLKAARTRASKFGLEVDEHRI